MIHFYLEKYGMKLLLKEKYIILVNTISTINILFGLYVCSVPSEVKNVFFRYFYDFTYFLSYGIYFLKSKYDENISYVYFFFFLKRHSGIGRVFNIFFDDRLLF